MTLHKFQCQKLVRDKVPEILSASGITVVSDRSSSTPYHIIKYAKNKLLEEAKEALAAENINELTEELADTMEVIELIADLNNIKIDEILQVKKQKAQAKGAFKNHIIIDCIEVPENHSKLPYYLKNYIKMNNE